MIHREDTKDTKGLDIKILDFVIFAPSW